MSWRRTGSRRGWRRDGRSSRSQGRWGSTPRRSAYWVKRARPALAARRAPRRGAAASIARRSQQLVERGLSVRADRAARSVGARPRFGTGCKQYGLSDVTTTRSRRPLRPAEVAARAARTARRTGVRPLRRGRALPLPALSAGAGYRPPARDQGDPRRGGGRALCRLRLRRDTPARCSSITVDPTTKRFASRPERGRALARASRARRPRKCVLLCANCHAEVEAGVTAATRVPVAGCSCVAQWTTFRGSSIGRAIGC